MTRETLGVEEIESVRQHLRRHEWGETGDEVCDLALKGLESDWQPGDELQLYTGMRTKACKLIARRKCVAHSKVEIIFDDEDPIVRVGPYSPQPEDFARLDGFASWDELKAFWEKHHPGVTRFRGVLIKWSPQPTGDGK